MQICPSSNRAHRFPVFCFFLLPVGRSRALLRPLQVRGRSTLLTRRLSQRVKVADSDLASDMHTTLFASAGAEREGEGSGDKEKGVGPRKKVMNHESFSLQFEDRRGGAGAGIQNCSLIISQDVEWH